GDGVGERVGSGAPVLLRDRHPHQPELGELADELVRKAFLPVELLGDGRNTLEGESSDRVPQKLVLGREIEAEAGTHRFEATPRRRTGTGVAAASVAAVARAFFEGLEARANAAKLAGIDHSYRFEIEGEGTWN